MRAIICIHFGRNAHNKNKNANKTHKENTEKVPLSSGLPKPFIFVLNLDEGKYFCVPGSIGSVSFVDIHCIGCSDVNLCIFSSSLPNFSLIKILLTLH